MNRAEMYDKALFKAIVSSIVEMYDEENLELEEKIMELEKEIEQTGYGEAYFFVTKGDNSEVDYGNCFRYKYYASYYDGMRAPFTVCGWNGTIDYLRELVIKHGILKEIYTPSTPISFDAFNLDPLVSIGGKYDAGGRSFRSSDFNNSEEYKPLTDKKAYSTTGMKLIEQYTEKDHSFEELLKIHAGLVYEARKRNIVVEFHTHKPVFDENGNAIGVTTDFPAELNVYSLVQKEY